MHPIFIFALIVGPMTALLLWVLLCEVRGVPAFTERPTPAEGELDTLGRWVLAGVCVAVVALAYAYGGIFAVLTILSLIAVLTTVTALVWTIGQLLRERLERDRATDPTSHSVLPTPFHLRFAKNFRRTVVQVPMIFASLG